jgi:phosphoenolpyruvate phosphomutase
VTRAEQKRRDLRAAVRADRAMVVVGAHDAMTARLIERHGFDGVWVSGLGVSAMAHGLPDLNLITLTETVGAATRIDSVTSLPVIVDCDNGFGSLSNVVRTVRELERAGVAAVCIEDNEFPKRNSLYAEETARALIPVDEQARRIRAAKAAQETEGFFFIARIESLIAGHGHVAAYERARAYADAGADALLVHSRDATLSDVDSFLELWREEGDRIPLVAVPTLFPKFTGDELFGKGFRVVIFANQPMRAAVRAMGETLATLRREERAAAVDADIAPVNDIFEIVHTKEAIALEEGV